MLKEIGSNFWFNGCEELENKEVDLSFLNVNKTDVAFLSSGRGAISFVLEHIEIPPDEKVALLPPFTCHTVIEPFSKAGFKVCFYRIGTDLQCDKERFLEDVQLYKPSVVLVHSYFGFNTIGPVRDSIGRLKENGIVVIEDITQNIYSEIDHIEADYFICSFRKWTALPDGGCAINANHWFQDKPVTQDRKLEAAKAKAFSAKFRYMEESKGAKEEFLRLFREAEQILSEQPTLHSMSTLSRKLQANLDIDSLRNRRRANFATLLEELVENNVIDPIFKTLPTGVTPLYFPVYVKCDRQHLQSYLASRDIYAPIVWPKPMECETHICQDANWVYNSILSIPCDQRYDIDDMRRISSCLKEYKTNLSE